MGKFKNKEGLRKPTGLTTQCDKKKSEKVEARTHSATAEKNGAEPKSLTSRNKKNNHVKNIS